MQYLFPLHTVGVAGVAEQHTVGCVQSEGVIVLPDGHRFASEQAYPAPLQSSNSGGLGLQHTFGNAQFEGDKTDP